MNLVGASLLQGSQASICNISLFLFSQIFFEVSYVFFFPKNPAGRIARRRSKMIFTSSSMGQCRKRIGITKVNLWIPHQPDDNLLLRLTLHTALEQVVATIAQPLTRAKLSKLSAALNGTSWLESARRSLLASLLSKHVFFHPVEDSSIF